MCKSLYGIVLRKGILPLPSKDGAVLAVLNLNLNLVFVFLLLLKQGIELNQ